MNYIIIPSATQYIEKAISLGEKYSLPVDSRKIKAIIKAKQTTSAIIWVNENILYNGKIVKNLDFTKPKTITDL